MTATNETATAQPTPLRDALALGIVSSEEAWRLQDVLIDVGAFPDRWNDRRWKIEYARECVTRVLAGDSEEVRKIRTVARHGDGWDSLQEYVTHLTWEADVYSDPELAIPLHHLLSADRRAELELWVDCARRPHPLDIDLSDGATCEACGSHVVGPVLRIAHREDYSDSVEAGPWCFSCVKTAYEAMRAAQG